MADTPSLFPELSLLSLPGRFVNPRCVIRELDGTRVAFVDGAWFHTWPAEDRIAETLFVVQAKQAGVATVLEIAAALERPSRTLFRALEHYAKGGASALVPKPAGRPVGSGIDHLRDATIRQLHAKGLRIGTIAKKLGCDPITVQRAHTRMGLAPNKSRQTSLLKSKTVATQVESPSAPVAPEVEKPEVPPSEPSPGTRAQTPVSLDPDPFDRSLDRFLASKGAIQDAAPLFASGQDLPYLGLLLAVPGLVASGLLQDAPCLFPKFGPAFYGLRTMLTAIVLFSLLRLKRPEHLKEFAPSELGRVLGLDRAPEVKTWRRKLHRLAEGASDELIAGVARRRAEAHPEAVAWLYMDGHVRVYHGKEKLPQTHVARMRISAPASQDIWVHDGDGSPVLLVTQEAHPSLAFALMPMLVDARDIVGPARVTVVFDRGGWSPALFQELFNAKADILTYRKGAYEPIPETAFLPYPSPRGGPDWLLHDMCTRLGNGLWVRQITRLVGTHQTPIVTTRQDLSAPEMAQRMFDRWRQENFFKYMRQEFDLDGLVEYAKEAEDPLRECPNPEWKRRDKAYQKARKVQTKILVEGKDPAALEAANVRVEELHRQRDEVSRRIEVGKMEKPTVRLAARAKNLLDGLKAISWQLETDLFRALSPFYRRNAEEGRTLLTAAFRSRGRLEVLPGELRVTLAPQSSPHRSRALAALCEVLTETATLFPGTNLRLIYAVEGTPSGGPAAT